MRRFLLGLVLFLCVPVCVPVCVCVFVSLSRCFVPCVCCGGAQQKSVWLCKFGKLMDDFVLFSESNCQFKEAMSGKRTEVR